MSYIHPFVQALTAAVYANSMSLRTLAATVAKERGEPSYSLTMSACSGNVPLSFDAFYQLKEGCRALGIELAYDANDFYIEVANRDKHRRVHRAKKGASRGKS